MHFGCNQSSLLSPALLFQHSSIYHTISTSPCLSHPIRPSSRNSHRSPRPPADYHGIVAPYGGPRSWTKAEQGYQLRCLHSQMLRCEHSSIECSAGSGLGAFCVCDEILFFYLLLEIVWSVCLCMYVCSAFSVSSVKFRFSDRALPSLATMGDDDVRFSATRPDRHSSHNSPFPLNFPPLLLLAARPVALTCV